MKDLEDFLWGFSIISFALYFLQIRLRKAISMASLRLRSPPSPLPSPPPPLTWVTDFFLGKGKGSLSIKEDSHEQSLKGGSQSNTTTACHNISQETGSCEMKRKGLHENHHSDVLINTRSNPLTIVNVSEGEKIATKLIRKRPARLVVPENSAKDEFAEVDRKLENKEFEVQGRDFFLASKKGRREVMEDGYGVMIDILGDAKQAFFAVIDGHGGRAAADYVAENLGKNIVKALENVGCKEDDRLEEAIRGGYSVTDKEFLSQGVSSGACTASVLLKDGDLHAANVGDCRVVLSRNGVADVLTIDHRVSREDERLRIENSGGFLHCRKGIWRVHGSLAVSRAIGDQHLKQWIISEPHIKSLSLTSDCQFLIMASDGLWDTVNEQEAIDVVLRDRNSVECCKKLVDMAFSRGNMDDITVMVINLQNFVTN